MSYSPLSIKRRHVLGDLYDKCDPVVSVPVYQDNETGEMLGYADEGLGHFADAFSFHLPEDICMKLTTGHYIFSFGYEYSDPDEKPGRNRKVKLTHICLTGRKPVEPVGPRARKQAKVE